jgi:hypothetical protein
MRLSGNSKLARWALALQAYRFNVCYRKGSKNVLADAVSRMENAPVVPQEVQPKVPQRANETPEQRIARKFIDFDFADSITAQPIIVAPVDEAARTSTPAFADIITAQADCYDFAPIIAYLKDGILPQDVKQARRIVAESQDFVIENQVLYPLFTPRTKRLHRAYAVIKQICISTQYRRCIAIELHDNVAHPGVDRVYAMARMRYYWPGMYTYLRDHVLTCATCKM